MAPPTDHTHYSISRDAVNDLALHYLAKMKVLVVREIEREDIEFIAQVSKQLSIVILLLLFSLFILIFSLQTLGCRPIASLDHFLPEHLGSAQLVEEVSTGTSKVVKVRIGGEENEGDRNKLLQLLFLNTYFFLSLSLSFPLLSTPSLSLSLFSSQGLHPLQRQLV